MSINASEWTYKAPELSKPWVQFSFNNNAKADNFIQLLDGLANPNLSKLDRSPFFFRGEDSLEYELIPKLCRIMNGNMLLENKLRYEYDAIDYFRERAGHYLPANQLPENPWDIGEWLALMQHYGAATRLLDWTASIYVAIYFAVHNKPKETGSVWVINNRALRDSMPGYDYGLDENDEVEKRAYTDKEAFVKLGIKVDQPIIKVFEPTCRTERISAQHSVLSYCHRQDANHGQLIGKKLMTVYPLTDDLYKDNFDKQLWRFEISPGLKTHLRRHLPKLGISAITLFPDLDGLGRAVTEIFTMHSEA